MSEKKCCVDSCDNSRLINSENLHIFPNPEKDMERFNIWLKAIGGHILSMDPKIVFARRRVCHLHFELKYHTWSNRLSANAIPTLLLHDMEYFEIEPYKARSRWYCRDAHYYVVKRTKGQTIYLCCASDRCPAHWSLKDGQAGPVTGQHNHQPMTWIPNRNALFQALKRRTTSENTAINRIYEEEAIRYADAASHLMFESVEPSMRKWRKRAQPATPRDMQDYAAAPATLHSYKINEKAISPTLPDIEKESVDHEQQVFEEMETLDDEVIVEEQTCDDPPSAPASPDQLESDLHIGYMCNVCDGDIKGFRYVCVQCADWDLCGGCEAAGAHKQHYVLRLPGPRPQNVIQPILDRIRQELELTDFIGKRIKEEDEENLGPKDPLQDIVHDTELMNTSLQDIEDEQMNTSMIFEEIVPFGDDEVKSNIQDNKTKISKLRPSAPNITTSASSVRPSVRNITTSASSLRPSTSNIISASNISPSAKNIIIIASSLKPSTSNITTSTSNISPRAKNIASSLRPIIPNITKSASSVRPSAKNIIISATPTLKKQFKIKKINLKEYVSGDLKGKSFVKVERSVLEHMLSSLKSGSQHSSQPSTTIKCDVKKL